MRNTPALAPSVVLVLVHYSIPCVAPSTRGAEVQAKTALVEPVKLDEERPLGKGPDRENSGIVKSRQWPDLYWMHNDSGDRPRIFPVRRDGSVYQSARYPDVPGVRLGGAINVDWEDIAVDSSGCVIVADIGNNRNDRRDLALYFVPEPSPKAGRSGVLRTIYIRYPDQDKFPAATDNFNFDAEAIFTLGDRVYICTKHRSDGYTTLYRLDAAKPNVVNVLTLVDRFDAKGQVTAADATPDGKQIVIATYDSLWLFAVADPDRPLAGPVRRLPYQAKQVEAVCFADDDTVLLADEESASLYEVPTSRFAPVRQ